MRLRQIILALFALASMWVGVAVQRGHHAHKVPAFTLGATPGDFTAPSKPSTAKPKLVHVPGLKRPVSATPIAIRRQVLPYVHANGGGARVPPTHRARVKPSTERPSEVTAVEDDGRSYAETSPPPLEPLTISNVQVSALTSSSARITWETNVPTLEQTAFGLGAPTVWTAPSSAIVMDHVSTINGLEFSTTYTAYVHAVDEWNRAQTASVTFTTGPMLDQSNARTSGNSIFVDDRPFFATAVWQQCSDMFGSNVADGINLFMGDGCKDDTELPARLGGCASQIVE